MQLTRCLSAGLFLISLLAFCQRAALASENDTLDAPPPNLTPATARLADILAQHDTASGSIAGATDSVIEKWTFTDTGISGTESLERSGANYHSIIAFGPFVEQYGQLDDKRWHQDFNGFTSPSSGVEGKSFAAVRVLEDAADPKNDVDVIGQTTGNDPAYVLKIRKPQEKHPEWMFYSKATGQIVRYEFVWRKRRVVQTYDDFRTTNGITEAWHIHDSDGRTELDDDWHLASVDHGATIANSRFAAPVNDRKSDVSARAPIPSVFVGYDTTVLRVQIGGRGLDFELDASEPQSIIERSVAESMGLPTFGQVTRLRDGTPVGYETILPDATIGPAHLHDFRIRSESFTYRARQDTRVVGVLGYDFLASHVVHVDFVHKLVELFPTDLFSASKPVEGGLDLPIKFDNGLLLVPMDFGSTFTDRVIVNNSFPYTVAFGSLFEEHPSDFSVIWSDKKRSSVPFADGDTVGQQMEIMVARTPSLRFAIADFGNHALLATNASYDASETKVDAMIGADYLRYFDLYFDYPHGRFIVKPNDRFYEIFSKTGSGSGS
jgi:hypothetical protein